MTKKIVDINNIKWDFTSDDPYPIEKEISKEEDLTIDLDTSMSDMKGLEKKGWDPTAEGPTTIDENKIVGDEGSGTSAEIRFKWTF